MSTPAFWTEPPRLLELFDSVEVAMVAVPSLSMAPPCGAVSFEKLELFTVSVADASLWMQPPKLVAELAVKATPLTFSVPKLSTAPPLAAWPTVRVIPPSVTIASVLTVTICVVRRRRAEVGDAGAFNGLGVVVLENAKGPPSVMFGRREKPIAEVRKSPCWARGWPGWRGCR